jgi:hypothetical protein
VFDAVAPAAAAADLAVELLLNGERAARLVQQHALFPDRPGLEAVLDRLITATFDATPAGGYEAEIGRAVQRVVVDRLMQLAVTARMPQVRAIATRKLSDLSARPLRPGAASAADRVARALIAADVRRFLERPFDPTRLPTSLVAPPGSPIGAFEEITAIPN